MANMEYNNFYKNLVNKNTMPYMQGCTFCEGKTKDGNAYYYINITFKNGFEKRLFLSNSDIYGIKDAINTVDKNDKFDEILKDE